MHSPELPQFRSVQLEAIPWTVLDSNKTHDAWAVVKSAGPILLSERIHPSGTYCALSNVAQENTSSIARSRSSIPETCDHNPGRVSLSALFKTGPTAGREEHLSETSIS